MLQMQAPYDMQKAWDARIRKFYGSRYDYKRNAVHTLLHQCCHLHHIHHAAQLLLASPVQTTVWPSNCHVYTVRVSPLHTFKPKDHVSCSMCRPIYGLKSYAQSHIKLPTAKCNTLLGIQIDWDYHMRLAHQGTPGLDPSAGSIIHFHHFRRWRECGVAYELRDCKYSQANPTLLSTAFGTRKEYKDRSQPQSFVHNSNVTMSGCMQHMCHGETK